jgi:transposase
MHPGCPIEQVYLYTEPIDFRKAIDGLSVLVEQELGLSPFASALYVFTNRHRNRIKALYWHRNGLCLWHKRLERDKFAWPQEANALTQTCSVPVLAELRAWMLQNTPLVTPKSALGTALAYMGNLWAQLTRYTERGDLPIDNNRCEDTIRPFVIDRKAWLFSDTPAGAHASAVIYSLVQTAKANGLEPYTWLRRVLRDLPAAKTVEEVEALLPWSLRLTDLVGNPAQ